MSYLNGLVVFPTFFNLSLNLAMRSSWSEPGDWNAKVGSQEILGVTGKFGLGVQNEAGQRLTEFCQENAKVIANTPFQQRKGQLNTWASPGGQH